MRKNVNHFLAILHKQACCFPLLRKILPKALPFPLVSAKMFARNSEARKEHLQKIKRKTYVMAGSNDASSQDNTDFIAANIPGSIEKILEGKSHTSHIVHNTKIAEIILELTGKK